MKKKKTLIRGLAIDVLVIETMQTDAVGMLFYIAEIHVRERKTGTEKLIRRTRVPGSGEALARDVQRLGVRALDHLSA
ncbi:hypothetical protein EDE05_117116 [Neorhizobium sp. R1-B]|uniref:hypothetical protein n=1 Tax=Neorhizobium sp. R1-B TaxID=2485162 RepID=UPI00106565C3|nr:hypothetical protein [Neorhizobium sp. R1-B]TDX76234.1 hypothetical protein EDE05_117116 [Neorhizobium sp. R1-B]